ncbi:MAG TPA: creatininase family protein [Vulgatibacter sp.]
MAPTFACDLTWEEMRDLAAAGAVAIVPVGSTEAHGPHLPLDTDVAIATEVATRAQRLLAAEDERSVVFPPLSYGVTEFAGGFAGTVTVSAAALEALVADVARSLADQGFGPVVLVNHHLEPDHFAALHRAAERAAPVRVVVPDHRRKPWALALGEEFCRGGSHAGRYETSLMLAVDPARVRADRSSLPSLDVNLGKAIREGARTFLEIGGERAYFGDPAAATAEEGEKLLDLLAGQVCEEVLSAKGKVPCSSRP